MNVGGLYLLSWITFVQLVSVGGDENIGLLVERLDDLDEKILIVERESKNRIDSAKISLRFELKQHIKRHVRDAMAELLQGESIDEMVKSQVISEVRHLKLEQHQMKRQLRHLLNSLTRVKAQLKTNNEGRLKAERYAGELKTCSSHIVDYQILQREMEQRQGHIVESNKLVAERDQEVMELKQRLIKLNETCKQEKMDGTNPTATESVQRFSTPETTSTSTMTTPLVVTRQPEEEKNRILIAPWSGTQQQLRQLNIHSNSVTNYAIQSLKYVTSLAYVSKLRKLLVGLYKPKKIIFSTLDSHRVTTVRENVRISGMAIDDGRDIVFMTTESPRKTISRMSTHGKHFTSIRDLTAIGGYPRTIAADSIGKKLYACNHESVFMVTYDGHVLQTLATGSHMFTVSLDVTNNLYYNDAKKLMKMSLSQNTSTEVTTLSDVPWNLVFYNNTVYFSSWGSSPGIIGAVDVGYTTTTYTLQSISMTGASAFHICLIP